ncbi:hypothetical protein JCM3770_000666 [Rhodotorula araucariae]
MERATMATRDVKVERDFRVAAVLIAREQLHQREPALQPASSLVLLLLIASSHPRPPYSPALLANASQQPPNSKSHTDPYPRPAIPFQFGPEDGLRVSETAAASAFGVPQVFRLLVSRFLRRWFGFNLDTEIRRIAFTPLLVPVWKVDLAMKGKAVVGDVQMQLNITALDASLPGFRLPPLSDLTVAPPFAAPPVPFSRAEHLTQHGERITLLPMTQHPLDLVRKLKAFPRKFSGPTDDGELGASVDPKQFDEVVFAAYPLYLPLYLGEFELDAAPGVGAEGEEKKRVTTAAFATVDGPAFAVYPQFLSPPAWLPPSDSVSLSITGRPVLSPGGAPPDPASVKGLQPRLLSALTEFKDEAEEGSFDLLDRVADADVEELIRSNPRVMALGEWAEANRAYVEAQGELDTALAMLEQVEALPEAARGLLLSSRGPRLSTRQDLVTDMQSKVDIARAKVDEIRPAWVAQVESDEKAR